MTEGREGTQMSDYNLMIVGRDGKTLFRYLRDEGNILTFERFGFVTKYDIRTEGWQVLPMDDLV